MVMGVSHTMEHADQSELPYQVRLETFEGSLDLLLHLIKKNEINIYDIPIALITQQYLGYLNTMTSFNLVIAGEFLVMAATLVQIKARMLLPIDEQSLDEEEGPDPREELVRRLLEYRQYQNAASCLDQRGQLWQEVFSRDGGPEWRVSLPDLDGDSLLEEVTLFDLVDAMEKVLARIPSKDLLEIIPENLTVKDRMNVILNLLHDQESVVFHALFEGQMQRVVVIVTFLALLELIRIKLVRVFQGETFGSILITRAFSLASEGNLSEIG